MSGSAESCLATLVSVTWRRGKHMVREREEMHVLPKMPDDNLLSQGYLSCCRFLDDNQIITSSGDTTW